jgi:hypothetical protein
MRHRLFLLLAAIFLLPTCLGCNRSGLDLQELSGVVSLDGRPIENGSIRFLPVAGDGLASGCVITAGRYRIPLAKGLPPGKYRVQISAADQRGIDPHAPPPKMGEEGAPLKELVPEKYNARTELQVEVKSGGRNVFDFAMNSR